MKNTEFVIKFPSEEFEVWTEQWKNNGYAVARMTISNVDDVDYAVNLIVERIKEERPNCEVLETATETFGNRICIAAKCRIRKEEE